MRARSAVARQRRTRDRPGADDGRQPAQQGHAARHDEPSALRLAPDDAHRPWRPRVVTTPPHYDAFSGAACLVAARTGPLPDAAAAAETGGRTLAEPPGEAQLTTEEDLVRIGNLDGRLVILTDAGAIDVERASGGQFGPDPQRCTSAGPSSRPGPRPRRASAEPYDPERLGAPSPAPRQSFGIGLNYRDHADESGFGVPDYPSVFTKFPSCITGPYTDVDLPPGGHTDWEVELVAVIGNEAWHVDEDDSLELRRRAVRRPGHLRADHPDGQHPAAVQHGQVVPRVRADRAMAGHPRRVRRTPTTWSSAARSTARKCRSPAPAT